MSVSARIVSMYQTTKYSFFCLCTDMHPDSIFFSFQPLACCVGRLFFFNSVVSAAVACAFNFSRFFLCFCCFVLLLVHAANLIWYAPHDDTLGERCLCCWNFSFRLFLSFDVQPECVCCYVCSCDCDCVCVFFVGALRLTTFTTLFMFT